jgi:tRNA 2-thiouridine synthesizing protein E
MFDNERISSELAEAARLMDKSVDTDINSIYRHRREQLLNQWSEAQAHMNAAELGLELSDEHLQVVYALREYYLDYGTPQSARQLSEMLARKFASQGGTKYLYRLFRYGPVKQGMHIAGLPVPDYTEDGGFGTSR